MLMLVVHTHKTANVYVLLRPDCVHDESIKHHGD